jgi:hypothetical protein
MARDSLGGLTAPSQSAQQGYFGHQPALRLHPVQRAVRLPFTYPRANVSIAAGRD